MKKLFLISFILIFVSLAFGQQIEFQLKKPCPYGYLEFIPKCSISVISCDTIKNCPRALLISLHGLGRRGNGVSDLHNVAGEGIAALIRQGQWNRTEFIVISPQLSTNGGMFSPKPLHIFIQQMIDKYKPDPSQVFIIGLSAGANSIYPYIETYRDVKSVIAVSGSGNYKNATEYLGTRIWAFHGDNDTTVKPSGDINLLKKMNSIIDTMKVKPPRMMLTIYPGVGHTGWQETFTEAWRDKIIGTDTVHHDSNQKPYTHYNQNIYDWLLNKN